MPQSPCDIQKDGRGAQIRTGDPLLPKQVRYQAALHPELSTNTVDKKNFKVY